MIFTPTPITGVFVLEVKKIEDERGFFGRVWCRQELEAHGINGDAAQINVAVSPRKGTIRGMHYQDDPFAETKSVRCTRGAVFDVAVDLRPESPTYTQWFGIELTESNQLMLVVPPGCAHGFVTLEDATDVVYVTTASYAPAAARGVRYDDPALRIRWPVPISVVSAADAGWPLLSATK
jgi:dTDP-4-dehydrorhamnose 3,5-epimerase